MSESSLRDNQRMAERYREQINQRANIEQMFEDGTPPSFLDETQYGSDGLPPESTKQYVV